MSATSAEPTRPIQPTEHYIVLCGDTGLAWVDSKTGVTLVVRPTVDTRKEWSVRFPEIAPAPATFRAYAFQLDGCATRSYNGTLSRVAGLVRFKQDTVPGFLDLASGKVVLAVKPIDHAGFQSAEGVEYYGAAFGPDSDDIWAYRQLDETHISIERFGSRPASTSVEVPDSNHMASIRGGAGFLGFYPDRQEPTIWVREDGLGGSTYRVVAGPTGESSYLDRSLLPETDYAVGNLVLSTDRSAAALIGRDPNANYRPVLFTMPSIGGSPTPVGTGSAAQENLFLGPGVDVLEYVS